MMKTSEILDAAAGVMERFGKTDQMWCYTEGPCCLMGAIHVAAGGKHVIGAFRMSTFDSPAGQAIARAVTHPSTYSAVHDTAEVIAMLRACAMTERAREARLMPVVRETVPA